MALRVARSIIAAAGVGAAALPVGETASGTPITASRAVG
jgi:hypothetical protein